ncbi:DUF4880 domain-containing protein [Pseudomonas sp. 148P]|uniref:DUF4880 domain-containing protein n=1 Tax=Pseudomonas ulcerans TaxID=3115852 RepID=A0ABU7HUM8_9PSED|nr:MULTISPECIES: DUF4880 domain-containing protein [unclassified Pseudomonas]MEE1923997.1 DUF4880 domain-containing protein [Pseudomonas sp. 147P]MEE1935240.1 DUF4880 domain-containing protein [Pseudomonas sp. 148P]
MKLFQPVDQQAIDEQVLEQALHWMVRVQSGVSSAEERGACEAWRAQHPAHELAWQRLAGLNHDLRQTTRALPAADARGLLRARGGTSRRALLKGLAGFAVLAATGVGVRERTLLPELFSDYRTGTGERQRLQLAAGVQVQLDTRTALDQAMTPAGLELVLNLGRVLVSTGRETDVRIRTAEGWLRPGRSSRVVVGRDLPGISGSQVQVFAGSATLELPHGDSLMLGAGRQADFSGAQQALSTSALAWSDGLLVVERMPLGLLLAHLDRYRRGVLRCAPEVAGLPVSGSYSLENPDASLELLSRVLPVKVERVMGLWATVQAA